MRYIFQPTPDGLHIKEGTRGNLIEIADGVKVASKLPILTTRKTITDYAPAAPRSIASAAFIARIPAGVWASVRSAAATSPELDRALYQLAASPTVRSDAPLLLALLVELVGAAVISADERAQILSF